MKAASQLDIKKFFTPKIPSKPNIKKVKAPKTESEVIKLHRKTDGKENQDKPLDRANELLRKYNQMKDKCQDLELHLLKANKSLAELGEARKMDLNLLEVQKQELDRANNQLRCEIKKSNANHNRVFEILEDLIRDKDDEEFLRITKKSATQAFEIGKIVSRTSKIGGKSGDRCADVWENGERFNELRYKQCLLLEKREKLEKEKKNLTKLKNKLKRNSTSNTSGKESDNSNSCTLNDQEYDMNIRQELEVFEQEESLKIRMMYLKKEENQVLQEKEKLRQEKLLYVRCLKRLTYQRRSRFVEKPILNSRYLLRKILGKGGFSEVWKAFDLKSLKDVAIKIHETDANWSESKKDLYLKHALREYKIHLNLDHPRIVKLLAVFEIDPNTFATVLEYCEGEGEHGADLDLKLKLKKNFSEKEARAILIQILSGLRYLNTGEGLENIEDDRERSQVHDSDSYEPTQKVRIDQSEKPEQTKKRRHPCIIHYDLKPGNILFDSSGNVKITDFGLSKIMYRTENDDSAGIELTSQFAGTYWYLPPECFYVPNGISVINNNSAEKDQQSDQKATNMDKMLGVDDSGKIKISSKVDVWSLGVIYYQMLFGKRPFGEGMTQQNLLQSQTMLKATNVVFPEKPVVSKDAKRFIKKCLTYRQQYRPDVIALSRDPYLRQRKV